MDLLGPRCDAVTVAAAGQGAPCCCWRFRVEMAGLASCCAACMAGCHLAPICSHHISPSPASPLCSLWDIWNKEGQQLTAQYVACVAVEALTILEALHAKGCVAAALSQAALRWQDTMR